MTVRNAISSIVELLDLIDAEFLQADGVDVFHVKALADDLRPFCTAPENVEEPKLGIAPTNSKFCDYCGSGGVLPEYVVENCPYCTTPENMEEPT